MVTACGPVTKIPQKTRVVFMVRARFAGCVPRKSYLQCSVALPRKYPHPRFVKIESYSPTFHGHRFHVQTLEQLDDEVQEWLRESYTVGEQKHLHR